MESRIRIFILITLGAFVISGCASSGIPMTSKMSDAIMMGIKTSQTKSISYEFKSGVADGTIKPCNKDSREPMQGHPGYTHTETVILNKMIHEYLSMKFYTVDNVSDPKIKVILRDFWIEQYSPDSTGKLWLVALGGGELNVIVVANLKLTYEILRNGTSSTKTIQVSADTTHVSGIGTHTSTSNIYRGTDSIEFRIAEAINAANNKAIAMLSQFLESNQL
jgi:hypothetical protein